jgi:hypothetical protein
MNMKTLYDGRQVDSSSEEWRAHCEATTMLAMPMNERHAHLNAVGTRRGDQAKRALSDLVRRIWIDRQARALNAEDNWEEVALRLHAIGKKDAQGARLRADIEVRMQELISNHNNDTERTAA